MQTMLKDSVKKAAQSQLEQMALQKNVDFDMKMVLKWSWGINMITVFHPHINTINCATSYWAFPINKYLA